MLDIDNLINEYVDLSIKRGHELTSPDGTAHKANQYFDEIKALAKKIKKIEGYEKKMKKLLNHENDYVKLDAAFELLPIYTQEVEDVLFELSQKRGGVAFSAEIGLERWKKGELYKDKN